jgi:hypothetical protein
MNYLHWTTNEDSSAAVSLGQDNLMKSTTFSDGHISACLHFGVAMQVQVSTNPFGVNYSINRDDATIL